MPMPEITITEFADVIREQMRAEMRVHRVEVEAVLKEVKTEVNAGRREQRAQHRELVALVAELSETVTGQTSTVNELAATRATWTRRVQLAVRACRWLFNSAPGLTATAISVAGATAAAIALL